MQEVAPMFMLELEDGPCGWFASVHGLEGTFLGAGAHGSLVSLMCGTVTGALASWARAPGPRKTPQLGNASLVFLATDRSRILSHFLGPVEPLRVFGAGPDAFMSELVIRAEHMHPLLPGVMEISRLWRDGAPTQNNLWSASSFHARRAWLQVVAATSLLRPRPKPAPRQRYVVDGRFATDYSGIFLALGEAMNGPCGYYGSNLDAVEDCLAGGFGPTPPFSLEWRRGAQHLSGDAWARESFWREVFDGGEGSSTEARNVFEALIEILREHDVTVDIVDEPSRTLLPDAIPDEPCP